MIWEGRGALKKLAKITAMCMPALWLLVACGGQNAADDNALVVMDVGTREGDRIVWDKTIAKFHESHPGIDVKLSLLKDDDYTKLHLPGALRSKRPPDIYFQWAGYAVHRDGGGGIARDLTDLIDDKWKAQFDERAFRGAMHDGRYFMIPNGMDASNVLWYRRSILKDNGIEPPKTWQEFYDACKKLKEAGVTPIVHGNQAGWPAGNWAAHIVEMYIGIEAYDALGDFKAPSRPPLNDPKIVEAVKLFEDLATLGAFNENIDTLNDMEGTGLFNAGKGAFHFNGGWIVEEMTDPDDVAVLAQPVPPGDVADPNSVLATAAGLMIHARSKHVDLAIELLRDLTSVEIQSQSVALGRSSPIKAALDKIENPLQKEVYGLLGKASNWVGAPDISWKPADAEEFNRAVKSVVAGRAKAQDALDAAARNVAR